MTERPILFSGPLVRALLAGQKTQTRRLLTPQPSGGVRRVQVVVGKPPPTLLEDGHGRAVRSRYGLQGDRLWVRETFAMRVDVDPATEPGKARHYAMYRADDAGDPRDPDNWHDYGNRWRPAIHMPRALSRLLLELTDVRVQRLQAITEDDARAEGVAAGGAAPDIVAARADRMGEPPTSARVAFSLLWDAINGDRATWASNPWVWALTFRRLP